MVSLKKIFLTLSLLGMSHYSSAFDREKAVGIAAAASAVIYGAVVIKNLWNFYPQIWEIEKKLNQFPGAKTQLYNWKLDKFTVNRPIVSADDKTFTDHHGQYDKRLVIEWPTMYEALKTDKDMLIFQAETKRKRQQADQAELKAEAELKERENKEEEFLFKVLQELRIEQAELEKDLHTLNGITSHMGGWMSIRRAYKSHFLKPNDLEQDQSQEPKNKIEYPTTLDQTCWSHSMYTAMDKKMESACHTGICTLMVANTLYTRAARLYWEVLKRQSRLTKIEERIKYQLQKIGSLVPLVTNDEEQKKLAEQIDQEDMSLRRWIVGKMSAAKAACLQFFRPNAR